MLIHQYCVENIIHRFCGALFIIPRRINRLRRMEAYRAPISIPDRTSLRIAFTRKKSTFPNTKKLPNFVDDGSSYLCRLPPAS